MRKRNAITVLFLTFSLPFLAEGSGVTANRAPLAAAIQVAVALQRAAARQASPAPPGKKGAGSIKDKN